jgi:hypothetical protein
MNTRFAHKGRNITPAEAVEICSYTPAQLLGDLINLLLAKGVIDPNETEELLNWDVNVEGAS